MSAGSLNADELIVQCELVTTFPSKSDFSLGKVHRSILDIMELEGYRPLENRKPILNSRTIKYYPKRREKNKSSFERIMSAISIGRDQPSFMDYHRQLEETRDDHPYEIEFRFFPHIRENEVELKTQITVTPAVVLQHEQVTRREDYNTQNIVRRCKEFTNTIASEFGGVFRTEPHTPATALRQTVDESTRSRLTEIEYGQKVIQFCDEGDEALRYGLKHSALASYIHAIEWTIITHIKEYDDVDLIEEEVESGNGLYYYQLVKRLKKMGTAHQTTVENLNKHNTDRRIMAHHKSGELSDSHVLSVKDTLSHLLEDTIR